MGRKLREWGVYKYDSKNRPSISAPVDTDDYNDPASVPVVGSDMDVRYPTESFLLKIEPSASVMAELKSSDFPGIGPKILSIQQAWASTAGDKDVGWPNSRSKDKIFYPVHYFNRSLNLAVDLRACNESLTLVICMPMGDPKVQTLLKSLIAMQRAYCANAKQWLDNAISHLEHSEKLCELVDWGIPEFVYISSAIAIPRLLSLFSKPLLTSYVTFLLAFIEWVVRLHSCVKRCSPRLSEVAAETSERTVQVILDPMPRDWTIDGLEASNDLSGSGPGITQDFDSFGAAWNHQTIEGSDSNIDRKITTVIAGTQDEQLSDIDMDRLSAMSCTSSVMSGFSSFRSLALRIKKGQSPASRNSVDDLPSSAMKRNGSSSSLQLFGRLSRLLSVPWSRKTDNSRMSWRPEIPDSLQQNSEVREMDISSSETSAHSSNISLGN